MAKEKRSSWVIRALKAAFADKPTSKTKVSRVKVKPSRQDNLYSATQNQVTRDSWLSKRKGGGRA